MATAAKQPHSIPIIRSRCIDFSLCLLFFSTQTRIESNTAKKSGMIYSNFMRTKGTEFQTADSQAANS